MGRNRPGFSRRGAISKSLEGGADDRGQSSDGRGTRTNESVGNLRDQRQLGASVLKGAFCMRYLLFACPFLIFAMSAPAQVDKSAATEEVPQEFKPKMDVELTPTAKTAVEVSESWSAELNLPAPGPDGRVVYSYGAGQPVIVCAPLRVCTI